MGSPRKDDEQEGRRSLPIQICQSFGRSLASRVQPLVIRRRPQELSVPISLTDSREHKDDKREDKDHDRDGSGLGLPTFSMKLA